MSQNIGTSTRSLHADDALNVLSDVAPPIHVATTYRYSNDPADLIPAADIANVCLLLKPSHINLLKKFPNIVPDPPVVRNCSRSNLPHLLPRYIPKPHPLRSRPLQPPKRPCNKLLLRPLSLPCRPHPPQPPPHLHRPKLPWLPRRRRPLLPPNRPPKASPRLSPH